jgi:hypothetical protein
MEHCPIPRGSFYFKSLPLGWLFDAHSLEREAGVLPTAKHVSKIGLWFNPLPLHQQHAPYSMGAEVIRRRKVRSKADGPIVEFVWQHADAASLPIGIQEKDRRRFWRDFQGRELVRTLAKCAQNRDYIYRCHRPL